MYDWVTHTHSLLGGECPHACSYCYVRAMAKGFPNLRARYNGPVRLVERELDVNYPPNAVVFIEHLSDLFAAVVSDEILRRVFAHLQRFHQTTFILQTKNPARALEWYGLWPRKVMLGTTIETNRAYPAMMGSAPPPDKRANALSLAVSLAMSMESRFVTIEPILEFDLFELVDLIQLADPDFVNIGADSKRSGMPEPRREHVTRLIATLEELHYRVVKKTNLWRLLEAKA